MQTWTTQKISNCRFEPNKHAGSGPAREDRQTEAKEIDNEGLKVCLQNRYLQIGTFSKYIFFISLKTYKKGLFSEVLFKPEQTPHKEETSRIN